MIGFGHAVLVIVAYMLAVIFLGLPWWCGYFTLVLLPLIKPGRIW